MRETHVYVVRGFLVFVAFMEFVNALGSLLPSLFAGLPHENSESFVQRKIFIQAVLSEESALIVGQVFGFYSLLNSAILVHAALFSYLTPLLTLGLLSLVCKVAFYLLQGLFYSTIPFSAYQVPLLISLLSLLGLLILLFSGDGGDWRTSGDENADLLRAMKFSRAKKRKAL